MVNSIYFTSRTKWKLPISMVVNAEMDHCSKIHE